MPADHDADQVREREFGSEGVAGGHGPKNVLETVAERDEERRRVTATIVRTKEHGGEVLPAVVRARSTGGGTV